MRLQERAPLFDKVGNDKVQPIHIVANDLGLSLKDKQILSGITCAFRPNCLYAVMGPSGAGKTMLLKVLAGRSNGKINGEILVNNQPPPSTRKYKMVSKYIPQDDVLFPSLTPRELLGYQAELVLASTHNYEERQERVEYLLEQLHLEECADYPIGNHEKAGISGGERRRVSIALELISNPSLLFLDEPTSGLDSTSAEQMVAIFRKLARSGHTIICTVHQPSIDTFSMFDALLLLNKGEMVYFGPVSQSVNYFARLGFSCPPFHNPVEYFMDLINGNLKKHGDAQTWQSYLEAQAQDWKSGLFEKEKETEYRGLTASLNLEAGSAIRDAFSEITTGKKKKAEPVRFEKIWKEKGKNNDWMYTSINDEEEGDSCPIEERWQHSMVGSDEPIKERIHGASLLRQTYTLIRRATWILVKDKAQFLGRVLATVEMSLLLGLVYFQLSDEQSSLQDRGSLLFVVILFNMLGALLSTAAFFPLERTIIMREYRNGTYHITAYYFSRLVVACIFQAFYAVIFAVILYWLVGLYSAVDSFFIFLGTIVLLGCIGVTLGIMVGALAPSVQIGQLLVPVCLVPLVLFAGFLVRPYNFPVYLKWIYWADFFQYGYQILCINEFRHRTFEYCDATTQVCPMGTGSKTGDEWLNKFLAYDEDNILRNFLVAGGWFLFCALAGLVIISFEVGANPLRWAKFRCKCKHE